MRRAEVREFIIGSASTASDALVQHALSRTSTANTGTGVTPSPTDAADQAALLVAKDEVTAQGTLGVTLMEVSLYQRNTIRWWAPAGEGLWIPATANAGILWRTPVSSTGTPRADVNVIHVE
jgi:hypothetical protein